MSQHILYSTTVLLYQIGNTTMVNLRIFFAISLLQVFSSLNVTAVELWQVALRPVGVSLTQYKALFQIVCQTVL